MAKPDQDQEGIGFHNIKGEAKVVKPEAMDALQNTILPKPVTSIMLIRLESSISHRLTSPFFKDSDGRGGKCSKSMITVYICHEWKSSMEMVSVMIKRI